MKAKLTGLQKRRDAGRNIGKHGLASQTTRQSVQTALSSQVETIGHANLPIIICSHV